LQQYLLVYYGGGAGDNEDEQKRIMDQWFAWFGQLGEKLKDGGLPFSGAVRSVESDGSAKDGHIGSESATGYTILMADSLDDATELAKACPVLESGGKLSIYECMDMGPPPE
jgi:hypothetical protein